MNPTKILKSKLESEITERIDLNLFIENTNRLLLLLPLNYDTHKYKQTKLNSYNEGEIKK